MRVVNPIGEPIDGLSLARCHTANKTLPARIPARVGYNFGGITGDVVLHVEPAARLVDIVVRAQLGTGVISVDVTVRTPHSDGAGRPEDRWWSAFS